MDETTLPPPSPENLKFAFDRVLHFGQSLTKLRDSALGNRLLPSSSNSFCVSGRSIVWKLFLAPQEPLQAGTENIATQSSLFIATVKESRERWTKLILDNFRAPDGTYEEGLQVPGSSDLAKTGTRKGDDLERNNPLSLDQNNPWKDWFDAVELRKTILQDVERTFPDIPFFRDIEVQTQLTHILFLYSVTHPDIGYRQGMHELLAPMYLAVHYDSVINTEDDWDPLLSDLCSRNWVTADSWALFDRIMQTMSKWYEWREPTISPSNKPSVLPNHVNIDVPSGPLQLQQYTPPIIETCTKIQNTLLRSVDPALWKALQATGIEPQIYGIRWLRLLFTREFLCQRQCLRLWDAIFACDPTMEIIPWICVAMLIRVRNELIPGDYSEQLSVLLRYPTFADIEDTHTTLLITQAVALQMAPNPTTGHSLVLENRNRLDIDVDVPLRVPPVRRRGSSGPRPSLGVQSSYTGVPPRQTPTAGLPEMFTRGILERGESFGINKTSFLNTFNELKKNIPDFNSFRPPLSPNAAPLPSYAQPQRSASPRSSSDMANEMDLLIRTNRQLGQTTGWIVDVLLQDETAVSDKELLLSQRAEALESLSHIRDVLNGTTRLDKERLIGEKQASARKAYAPRPQPLALPQPQKPASPRPVSVVDNSGHRSSRSVSEVASSPPSAKLSKPAAVPRQAPWNYTQSAFSPTTPSLPSATLPRMPPAASRAGPRDEVKRDPLGAL
ncbi:RabGAP/TBC [Flagelloscypha sp. PMI_526]|nr:RabGAP/TBC [Flagelloscypha sp. PMI_526]